MNRLLKVGGVIAVAMALPACATITRGTSEKFKIETTPAGADVELSSGQTCVSPCELKLKRKDGFTVKASKPGYETATATVTSETKGGGIAGAAGNVLIGGIVGGVIDGSNGSMKDLTPNPLQMHLKPIAVAASPASAAAVATMVETTGEADAAVQTESEADAVDTASE